MQLKKSTISFVLLFAWILPVLCQAEGPAVKKLSIRVFMNDPIGGDAKIYTHDTPDSLFKVEMTPDDLPAPQMAVAVDGKLRFYGSPDFDPEKPGASLLATASVSVGMKSAIVILQPKPLKKGKKKGYGALLVNDSLASFGGGESRVVVLTSFDTACEIGEYRLRFKPGKVTSVASVKKLDAFNMAQTSFFYRRGENWVAFSETQMKYLPQFRQIFIASAGPGGKRPVLTTLVDIAVPLDVER